MTVALLRAICVFWAATFAVAESDLASLLIDYTSMKLRNQMVVYTCASSVEKLQLFRALSNAGIFSSFVDNVAALALQKAPRAVTYVQLMCVGATRLLQEAGERGEFSGERAWLLDASSDDAGTARAILTARTLPLYVHCDVKLMLRDNGRWVILDAWSVAGPRGAPFSVALHAVRGFTEHQPLRKINYNDHEVTADQSLALPGPTEPLIFELESGRNYSHAEVLTWWSLLTEGVVARGEEGWCDVDTRSRVRRRWDLQQRVTLRAAYCINNKPSDVGVARYLDASAEPHRDTFTRCAVALTRHAQSGLHFRMIGVRTGEWGELRNGSMTGVIGALAGGHADIGLSPMLIKVSRIGAADVAGYAGEGDLPTIFRQPQGTRASLAEFTRPLSAGAWAGALLLAALGAALGAAAGRLEPTAAPEHDGLLLDFLNAFYLNGRWRGSAAQRWGGRTAGVALGALGLLLQQFYAGSLLGALLAPPPRQISNLAQLLASELDYKAEDAVYHHLFFREPRTPLIQKLWHDKLSRGPLPPFMPVDEGLRRVERGGFAFQTTATYAYRVARRWTPAVRCSLDALRVHPPGPLYSRLAPRSPYTQHFRVAAALQAERGVLRRELARWYPSRPHCPPAPPARLPPVGRQLYPALHLLAALCVVATALMFVERAVAWRVRRRGADGVALRGAKISQ